jgi:zinc transport system substrate-binding protein
VTVVRLSRRSVVAGAAALLAASGSAGAAPKRLRIGVTLHPYYSYVANIVGDRADVVPLIPVGFNPHAYEPRGEDIKRLGALDVVVLNGIGHDDFAERMIRASENPNVAIIEANRDVPLLAAVGQMAQSRGRTVSGKVVNSHTFLSITGSIAQVQTIARELGRLDPANAAEYQKNARAYAQRLRKIRAAALSQIAEAPSASFRVATIHGAYDYLLREFGLEVTAVVEPAHGVEPSPAQLAKTIEQIKALDVKVIFSELNFPSAYVDTIRRETGVRLYPLSHVIYGAYSPEKFEVEMAENFATVVRAVKEMGGAPEAAANQ